MSTLQKIKRTLKGTIVSDKMAKTIVVRVDRTMVHPKYGKRYVRSQTYHVHDEKNAHHVNEVVSFQECRPYSKTKRWRIVG